MISLYNEGTGEIENLAEIKAAFQLFQSLHHDQDNKMWKELFEKAKEFTYLWQDFSRASFLLTNYEQSIQDQLDPLLPHEIKKIECFVPYFDRSLSVINEWNDRYQPENINIYLQDQHTNFPRETICGPSVALFEAVFQENSHKRYHGKVFRFIGEEKELIVYGSGNCSRQALLYPFHSGGNLEGMIVQEGQKGEFDFFFNESIFLKPLPNPLPKNFQTMDTFDQEERDNKGDRIQFVDGIIHDKQLFVSIKTKLPLNRLLVESKEGILNKTVGDYYLYAFRKIQELRQIYTLEAYVEDECLSFKGWFHDPESLQNTFYNMKQSVYFKLPNDPYLEDYQNLVALLDDLQNRLVLTEQDVDQNEKNQNQTRSIHQQAELGAQETFVSNSKDDYYASEETVFAYGSIGNVDVVGNLIRIMLREFYEETATTLDITSEKTGRPTVKMGSEEVPKDLREQLQKRMKRFMTKFNRGITSDQYLEQINPDVLIKNMTIYSGFLFKLKQKLGEHFLTNEELLRECFEMVKALERYSEHNILDPTRDDMQLLLIQSLATIYTREDILLSTEENYHIVRSEKKKLGELLKCIHQQIHPVGHNISKYSDQVVQFLKVNFGLKINVEVYEQSFADKFPLMNFIQLEKRIKDMGVVIKKGPMLDTPTIWLEREINITAPEFNFLQLKIMTYMLSTEEWESAPFFEIRWFNSNSGQPLAGFILDYDQYKRIVRKTYIYKERERLIVQKNNIFKHQLMGDVEKGSASIIGKGFK